MALLVTCLSKMEGGGNYRKEVSQKEEKVGSRSYLKAWNSSLHTKCEFSVPCILRTLFLNHIHRDWVYETIYGDVECVSQILVND